MRKSARDFFCLFFFWSIVVCLFFCFFVVLEPITKRLGHGVLDANYRTARSLGGIRCSALYFVCACIVHGLSSHLLVVMSSFMLFFFVSFFISFDLPTAVCMFG